MVCECDALYTVLHSCSGHKNAYKRSKYYQFEMLPLNIQVALVLSAQFRQVIKEIKAVFLCVFFFSNIYVTFLNK